MSLKKVVAALVVVSSLAAGSPAFAAGGAPAWQESWVLWVKDHAGPNLFSGWFFIA